MRRAAEFALLALLGVMLTALWLNYARWDLGPDTGLAALVAGTAHRPFVYRQLAPLLVRGLMALGVEMHQAATCLVAVSFVGWLWALRWLAQLVTPKSAMVATLLACGPVSVLFVSGGYVYDPLMLCLFTLGLALLARERWGLYAVLFPLLMLCRETAILLIPVHLLWGWDHQECHSYARAFAWQVACMLIIKSALAMVYAGNGGALFEIHWEDQLWFLWFAVLPNVLALSVYGAALAAGLWRWRDQHPFMRSAAVILPIMFVAYWIVAYPGEIRVFLEAYPVLYLFTWHTVWTRMWVPTARWLRSAAPSRRTSAIAELQ
jgi:hypothetical protein